MPLHLEGDQERQADHQRHQVVNRAVRQERADDRRRRHVRSEQEDDDRLEHAEPARNVAENSRELRQQKNAEHWQKGKLIAEWEQDVQYGSGRGPIDNGDGELGQCEWCRGNGEFPLEESEGLVACSAQNEVGRYEH